jgi:hypothetical protein
MKQVTVRDSTKLPYFPNDKLQYNSQRKLVQAAITILLNHELNLFAKISVPLFFHRGVKILVNPLSLYSDLFQYIP